MCIYKGAHATSGGSWCGARQKYKQGLSWQGDEELFPLTIIRYIHPI